MADASFFPLQVGNTWTYRCSGAGRPDVERCVVTKVIDTVSAAGQTYFVLANHFTKARNIGLDTTALVRMADSRLLLRLGDAETLWLDFSASVGDSWEVPMLLSPSDDVARWASISLASATDALTVGGSSYGAALGFHVQPPYTDGDWSETYARAIGPVLREGVAADGAYVIRLTEADLGGQHLSFPTAVREDGWGHAKSPRCCAGSER